MMDPFILQKKDWIFGLHVKNGLIIEQKLFSS
jgi:hypothetical protein